jgi:transposase
VNTIRNLTATAQASCGKYQGRGLVADRAGSSSIFFVLRTGRRWRDLPAEMHCGSRVSRLRRLRDCQGAGVCDRLQELTLAEL